MTFLKQGRSVSEALLKVSIQKHDVFLLVTSWAFEKNNEYKKPSNIHKQGQFKFSDWCTWDLELESG